MFPKAEAAFQKVCNEDLQTISSHDFRKLKDRVATAILFLHSINEPDAVKRQGIIHAILTDGNWQTALKNLGKSKESVGEREKGWLKTFTDMFSISTATTRVQDRLEQAHREGQEINDSRFLCRCLTVSQDEEVHAACKQLRQMAHAHFTTFLPKKLRMLKNSILHIQQEECQKQLRRESDTAQSETLFKARSEFLSQIERLPQTASAGV